MENVVITISRQYGSGGKTIAAMLEAENIAKDPNVKGYTDLDEMFADLKK